MKNLVVVIYHTTLGYGGMEYNLPEPVSIFDDFVEDTWMKYWTLAWDYPSITLQYIYVIYFRE